MLLEPDDIDVAWLGAAKMLHYGSISLISEPSRTATLSAVEAAIERGLLISYDPNLRLNLWPSADEARRGMLDGWEFAHVAKVSREELTFLSGEDDFEAGAKALWHDTLRLLVVTDGAKGCYYVTAQSQGHVPGYSAQPVDTTGAGDGFVAGLLAGLLEHDQAWDDELSLTEVLRFANAVGALATTKRGAIPALPTRDQISELVNHG
jgi:fructokinase